MYVSPMKRRILVSGFQYRLAVGNFLYLTAIVVAFLGVMFGPVVIMLGDETVPLPDREVAANQMLVMHERVLFALPVLIALCILHSVLVSHRIAGPLHRFKQVFAELTKGNLSMDVDVRKNDYLRPEAEMMAEMVQGMRERVQSIRDAHRQASLTLPHVMDAVGRGAGEEASVLTGKLGTEMDILGQRIQQFNVPGTVEATAATARPAPTRDPVSSG